MDDRGTSQQQRRPRSKDRSNRSDQRAPTFQVLNAVQPRTHTHGKRDYGHYGMDSPSSHYLTKNPDRATKYERDSSHLQKRLIGVHTIGNKSSESVTSACRGPACNFATDLGCRHNINSNNIDVLSERYHARSTSPVDRISARPRSQSPQDRVVMDEASDLVVWNASKKASRSNLLCPLTDSEYRSIAVKDTKTLMKPPRPRSNSVPGSGSTNYNKQFASSRNHPSGISEIRNNDVLFSVDNFCKEAVELLDDFAPPPMNPSPRQVSPSGSIASNATSYSVQISLVTQQLEEIQQAQNDVLKHLGEEIAKVTGENERLTKELEHIRNQNEGLLKVVHDTTDELERMKHIFRTRGLSNNQLEANTPSKQAMAQNLHLQVPQQQCQPPQRPSKHHLQGTSQGGKRDSITSSSSNTSKKAPLGDGDPALAHLMVGMQDGEENVFLKQGVELQVNKPKRKKSKQQVGQQNEQSNEDRQDATASGVEDINDDTSSFRSTDTKGQHRSSRRKHGGEHHHHHSHQQNPQTNGQNHDPQHRRSRSHSRDRQATSKSSRTSNISQQSDKKVRHAAKPVYVCNDEIETRHNGCCFFPCCGASPRPRLRTDSVDDMVLRGCPE